MIAPKAGAACSVNTARGTISINGDVYAKFAEACARVGTTMSALVTAWVDMATGVEDPRTPRRGALPPLPAPTGQSPLRGVEIDVEPGLMSMLEDAAVRVRQARIAVGDLTPVTVEKLFESIVLTIIATESE